MESPRSPQTMGAMPTAYIPRSGAFHHSRTRRSVHNAESPLAKGSKRSKKNGGGRDSAWLDDETVGSMVVSIQGKGKKLGFAIG